MTTMGWAEMLIVALFGCVSMVIPVATLVGVLMTYSKLKQLEELMRRALPPHRPPV